MTGSGPAGGRFWQFTSPGLAAVQQLTGGGLVSVEQAPGGWFIVREDGLASRISLPEGSRAEVSAGDLLVSMPAGAVSVRESRPLLTARWVQRGDEKSLRIEPADSVRMWSTSAAQQALWTEVLNTVPEADSPGMRDQFVCHVAFAATKEAWFLEPARPDVGYPATVAARCNPGAVPDGG